VLPRRVEESGPLVYQLSSCSTVYVGHRRIIRPLAQSKRPLQEAVEATVQDLVCGEVVPVLRDNLTVAREA
jgi:hypothetical protein